MIEKIKTKLKDPSLKQFQDVRVIGLVAFGILALLVSWSTISAIQTNYELQKQISDLEQENKVTELSNANQKLTNAYYDTNQFLELAARRQFGKAAPGEKLLLVPKDVALSKTTSSDEAATEEQDAPAHTSGYQQNFQAWMNFFLNRREQ